MMATQKYSKEFKFEVVKTYLSGELGGMRKVARHFDLPSKNYIETWIKHFKKLGTIPQHGDSPPISGCSQSKSENEIRLEEENLRLRAENAYLKKLEEIERRNAQKR